MSSGIKPELILFVFLVPLPVNYYIRGLGLGVGVAVGLPLGVGLGIGSPGDGLGLPPGLGFGSGLASGVGVAVGAGLWAGIALGDDDGFATSVPVAVPLLPIFDVVNIHCVDAPVTGDKVSLVPLFLPRNDITGEFAPDICRATAVYPLDFEAMIRPVLPSEVVNVFPVIVSVVSPLSPAASQLANVPV